jgi:hypothetical protein
MLKNPSTKVFYFLSFLVLTLSLSKGLADPVALSINSPASNGTYGQKAVVDIVITLNEPVQSYFPENSDCVSRLGGFNWISLNAGHKLQVINSVAGKILTANYIVGNEDSEKLNVVSSSITSDCGLKTNSGKIFYSIPLPDPKGPNSLAANKDIKISGYGAKIVRITSPNADGIYPSNGAIYLQVEFDRPVTVHPTIQPYLVLRTSPAYSRYVSGSGTDKLSFKYEGTREVLPNSTSQSQSPISDKVKLSVPNQAPLEIDPGLVKAQDWVKGDDRYRLKNRRLMDWIQDDRGYSTNIFDLIPEFDRDLWVKTQTPKAVGKVIGVKALVADGTYFPGQTVPIEVEFERPVFVTGKPALNLNPRIATYCNYVAMEKLVCGFPTGYIVGSRAIYSSGSGSSKLTFVFEINAQEPTTNLLKYMNPVRDYASAPSLTDFSSGIKWNGQPLARKAYSYHEYLDQFNPGCFSSRVCSIKDSEGNFMNLSLPPPGSQGALDVNSKIAVGRTAVKSGK